MADNELHRMVGQVQAGIEHLNDRVKDIQNECKSNSTQITAMASQVGELATTLKDVGKVAEDWAATKKRGLLVLAGVGSAGVATGIGLPKAGMWIKAILLGG